MNLSTLLDVFHNGGQFPYLVGEYRDPKGNQYLNRNTDLWLFLTSFGGYTDGRFVSLERVEADPKMYQLAYLNQRINDIHALIDLYSVGYIYTSVHALPDKQRVVMSLQPKYDENIEIWANRAVFFNSESIAFLIGLMHLTSLMGYNHVVTRYLEFSYRFGCVDLMNACTQLINLYPSQFVSYLPRMARLYYDTQAHFGISGLYGLGKSASEQYLINVSGMLHAPLMSLVSNYNAQYSGGLIDNTFVTRLMNGLIDNPFPVHQSDKPLEKDHQERNLNTLAINHAFVMYMLYQDQLRGGK